MRKLILTFALIWISLHGKAQVHSFGIQGGLNLANITANNSFEGTQYKPGLIGGITYELLLSEKYLLAVDMLYSQQGFVNRIIFTDPIGNPTGEDADLKYNYNYYSFPLKFGYKIGSKFCIVPKVGIQPSLLLSAKIIFPKFDNNGNVIGEETLDAKENISQFDLAGLAELGFGYAITKNLDVFTSLAGKYSATTLSKETFFEQSRMRHLVFSLSAGIKYKLGKE